MVDAVHRNLTGADLHEPKGADTALVGQVYVSDGAGSGAWETASSVITNTAWSTGDVKLTHKITADDGWIMWSDQTIGDGSSGATARANADCADLFALYWNSIANTYCPVSGGRGASAAADFAAHKTIGIPKSAGRALGIAGSGVGLSTRQSASTLGAETVTLTTTNIPSITCVGNNAISVTSAVSGVPFNTTNSGNGQAQTGTNNMPYFAGSISIGQPTSTGTNLITVTTQGTNATAFDSMNPMAYLNAMIKL